MQLRGPSVQGTVERTEEGDAMFQRFRTKYEEAIERERATEETRRILELLDKESDRKEQFDKVEMGPDFESKLEERCYCRDREAGNESACLKRAEGEKMETVMCHFCEEETEGIDRKTRAELSIDAIEGRMVLIEIEQAEGDAPYFALRHMEQGTRAFRTFAPTRDVYSIFAVAMKMAHIASDTKRPLKNQLKKATAKAIPKLDYNNAAVGADNIMQVVDIYSMSEYIYETEQAEDHKEQTGERWPDTKGANTKKRSGLLKMITQMLRAEVQGEVLASRNCNWVKEWAQQWDCEVTHYKYGRKSHLLPVDQDGRVEEGYLGEQDRLTQVEYTEKELQQDVLDHTTVVTQAEQFMTTQRLTDAMVAGKVGCDINEFRRWRESKQSCRLKERSV